MPDFEVRLARRARGVRRRGLSGLGLLLVAAGLLVLGVAYSSVPAVIPRLWPLVLIGVGLFGVLRQQGWVVELDALAGRPRRGFSLLLIGTGCVSLLFTSGLVDVRLVGPGVLIALGLLLVWRRVR